MRTERVKRSAPPAIGARHRRTRLSLIRLVEEADVDRAPYQRQRDRREHGEGSEPSERTEDLLHQRGRHHENQRDESRRRGGTKATKRAAIGDRGAVTQPERRG